MNRRIIGLLVAVALAAVATFFLAQWVTSADERARQEEQLTEVFVAQGDIPPGTTAADASAQGLIARDTIPARSVPAGAIGDLDQIAGLVAAGPIYDGEVVVAQRFGATAAQVEGLLEVPEGLQAVTVEAGIVSGLAGFVQAQDTVSVVATLTMPDEEADAPPPAAEDDDEEDAEEPPGPGVSGAGGERTEYLVQNATVLAVGQRVVTTEEGQAESRIELSNERYIFTLGMTPEDIEQLVFAFQQGQVHFTLLPDIDEDEEREEADTPGRTIENVFD